jgi:3-oxoacyl-[acyl-carrier protein] reductase
MPANPPSGQLNRRVALITGGSRGIGYAIARRFGQEGARVFIADVDEAGLSASEKTLQQAGIDATGIRMDVTLRDSVEAGVGKVVKAAGRLDVLVNNAGVIRDQLLFRMSDTDWEQVMDVHLKGAFLCSREAQATMVKQRYGRIINLSSTSALGNRGQANYAAAKAGIQGFTKTLAIELGSFGITANAIAPGFIDTEMTRATAARLGLDFEAFAQSLLPTIPAGRLGTTDDVAAAALFFALETSSYVNGQILYVAGGPKG